MKSFVVPIAALALGLTISTAQAEEAKGKIAQVDPAAGIIVLDSGETFMVTEGVAVEDLVPGTEVSVSYERKDDGRKVAEEVVPTGQ